MSAIIWVRLPKYLRESGEARSTWYELRDAGEFLEGTHYRYDSRNRVWINTEAMSAWVEGKLPKRNRRVG